MVNMIGFHHVEPRFNTAGFGEDGWYCNVKPMPTTGEPLRARVTTPCAYAIFHDPADARQFTDHPGDLPHMADIYLEWTETQ